MKNPLELYIHIPFCIRKCNYCDFLSFSSDEDTREQYVEALCREIREYPESGSAIMKNISKNVNGLQDNSKCVNSLQNSSKCMNGLQNGNKYMNDMDSSGHDLATSVVESIFIGGGTPSTLTVSQTSRILEAVYSRFSISDHAEISMECNPGTLSREKLRTYHQLGINRLSLGLQSTDDQVLKTLGRIHTFAQFKNNYITAREEGFENINIDLMSALPGQSLSSYLDGLKTVAELAPEHLSSYSLILEEGTPFYDNDRILSMLPDEDTERAMYESTKAILAEHGYHRYEISNYALKGRECRHNLGYWSDVPYLGFGLGAASYIKIPYLDSPTYSSGPEEIHKNKSVKSFSIPGNESDKPFSIHGNESDKSFSIHGNESDKPLSIHGNESDKPLSIHENESDKPLSIHGNDFDKTISIYGNESDKTISIHGNKSNKPFSIHGNEPDKFKYIRMNRTRNMKEYLAGNVFAGEEPLFLSLHDRMEEYMFLGLRKTAGVSISGFEHKFGSSMDDIYGSVIEKYAAMGLLKCDKSNDILRLTDSGIDVSNRIFSEFLFD